MLIYIKPEMLTPSRDFLRWIKRRLRNDFLPFLVFIICCVHLHRVYVHDEFFLWTTRKCQFQKTDWLKEVDDKSYFSIMWQAIPNIVNICSYGVWSDRMYTFESDGQEAIFMESFPEHPVQRCNILFVTDNADLTIPTDIKLEYNNCNVHVSSDKLPSTFSNSLSIATYPYKIKPGEPLKEDLFADVEPFSILDQKWRKSMIGRFSICQPHDLSWSVLKNGIVFSLKEEVDVDALSNSNLELYGIKYFCDFDAKLMDQHNVLVRDLKEMAPGRYRMTSVVINTKDAHRLVPMFFSDGSVEKSRLTTCQLNIAYPKPRTYQEMQDFRIAWERLVDDRYYLVRHASRTKDTLNLFLVNIINPICWQLYVALDLPTTVTF